MKYRPIFEKGDPNVKLWDITARMQGFEVRYKKAKYINRLYRRRKVKKKVNRPEFLRMVARNCGQRMEYDLFKWSETTVTYYPFETIQPIASNIFLDGMIKENHFNDLHLDPQARLDKIYTNRKEMKRWSFSFIEMLAARSGWRLVRDGG